MSDKSLLLESPWAQRFELLVEMLLNFLGFDVEGAPYPTGECTRPAAFILSLSWEIGAYGIG